MRSLVGRPFGFSFTIRFGLVMRESGSGATSAFEPYFARSSSIGPNSIARNGQLSTHTGIKLLRHVRNSHHTWSCDLFLRCIEARRKDMPCDKIYSRYTRFHQQQQSRLLHACALHLMDKPWYTLVSTVVTRDR